MTARVVAVSSGDSPASKTRALAQTAIDIAGDGELVDLLTLSAPGLLGREADSAVSAAVDLGAGAEILVVATPVYRATYNASLKAFFDRFAPNALARTAVVLCATAAIPQHFLALDTGLRPLIASLAGWSVPTTVYATSEDFVDGRPAPHIVSALTTALDEAANLAASIRVKEAHS